MEVNDELGALEQGLRVLTSRLEPGSRIAVISFHSLEDRMVKNFFRDRSRELLDRPEWPEPRANPDFALRLVTSKPVEAGENEQRVNPRSRSAKLHGIVSSQQLETPTKGLSRSSGFSPIAYRNERAAARSRP